MQGGDAINPGQIELVAVPEVLVGVDDGKHGSLLSVCMGYIYINFRDEVNLWS
jgi:hypothetical protein